MTGIVAQAPTESRWERIGPPVRLDSAGYESTPKDYEVQGLYTSNTGTVITAHSIDLTFREMVMGFWNPIRMNGSIITTALRHSKTSLPTFLRVTFASMIHMTTHKENPNRGMPSFERTFSGA